MKNSTVNADNFEIEKRFHHVDSEIQRIDFERKSLEKTIGILGESVSSLKPEIKTLSSDILALSKCVTNLTNIIDTHKIKFDWLSKTATAILIAIIIGAGALIFKQIAITPQTPTIQREK